MYLKALLYISFVNVVAGRDFAIGMFRHNDILVAQDIVYKERVPFRETTLKYGKTFTCLVSIIKLSIIHARHALPENSTREDKPGQAINALMDLNRVQLLPMDRSMYLASIIGKYNIKYENDYSINVVKWRSQDLGQLFTS